jgi:hypothetical protein
MTSRHVIKIIRSIKGESVAHMRARISRELKEFAGRNVAKVKFVQANIVH